MSLLLAIDQGTTSTRAVLYRDDGSVVSSSQLEFSQHYPQPGWVEHDAEEIWQSVLATAHAALRNAEAGPQEVAAIGITNQRETVVLWDRRTGKPVQRAIVWQDRRTHEQTRRMTEEGLEPMIREKTGLVLDPYFSAMKLAWMLGNSPALRDSAVRGELAAGTIESWLVYRMTGGATHITDVSNASRTLLMNLRDGAWDPELLEQFDLPASLLPRIVPNSGSLAVASPTFLGAEIPITGMAGDQQAALFGQLCTRPGMGKCTYGTGCFLLTMTGPEPKLSGERLLTTVAWKLGDAAPQYALEGSVFVGGAAIQWLRDGLKLIPSAPEVNRLAGEVTDSDGVFLVPAFAGLGAPYWDASARGALFGITRGTTAAHIARATLDGIAFQVSAVVRSMERDSGTPLDLLRVDGGAAASDLLMQIQSDLLGVEVERPRNIESTALGACYFAGLGAGIWTGVEELEAQRQVERVFHPGLGPAEREARIERWEDAVRRTRDWPA